MKLKIIVFALMFITLSSFAAEAQLTKTEVSQLFVALFNRASEGNGNAFFQSDVPDFETMEMTANYMLTLQVVKDYFGASFNSNQAFIELIYKNTLNRVPADGQDVVAGIAFWVSALDQGYSRGFVVSELIKAINDYGPGGSKYNPADTGTTAAYNQFANRVEVSDYLADHQWETLANYDTVTRFGTPGGLNVTHDQTTLAAAKETINTIIGQISTELTTKIESYISMVSSAGDLSGMVDEIGALLSEIMSGDSSVVVITPSLDDLDLENLPSSITVTANFGAGYTPEGSTSVYSGQAVISITNLALGQTGITANMVMTATNVKRDGQLILNGTMSMSINIGILGSNITLLANAVFTNLQILDSTINGGVSINVPAINLTTGEFQTMTLTFNQLTTQDFQISGTVVLTDNGNGYDAVFNLTTNEGPVTGTMRIDTSNPDQTVLSTPSTMTMGGYTVDINNVILAPETCTDYPIGGNIVIAGATETRTITFNNNCTYSVD